MKIENGELLLLLAVLTRSYSCKLTVPIKPGLLYVEWFLKCCLFKMFFLCFLFLWGYSIFFTCLSRLTHSDHFLLFCLSVCPHTSVCWLAYTSDTCYLEHFYVTSSGYVTHRNTVRVSGSCHTAVFNPATKTNQQRTNASSHVVYIFCIKLMLHNIYDFSFHY